MFNILGDHHYNFSLQLTSFDVSTVYFEHTYFELHIDPMLLFITLNKHFLAEKQHKLRIWWDIYLLYLCINLFRTNVPYNLQMIRSSHYRCYIKRTVLKNFLKFKRKQRCQNLFLIKLQVSACNFIKKEILAQVLSFEFCKIFKSSYFQRTCPGDCSWIL